MSELEDKCIVIERFWVLTAMKIQVVVFLVLTQCTDVVGYQRFGGPCCHHVDPEDRRNVVLRNVDILPHHYTASQYRIVIAVVIERGKKD
jgi:hypothetical protein